MRDTTRSATQDAGGTRTTGRVALARAVLVGAAALTLADCARPPTVRSGRHASELKYGVASSPRVIPEGQPIPKGGGRDMVGQPYVVAGRTYTPHEGRGYDREGWASWYGTAFHGRLTANGEIFDRDSVAAAHPTLPLPSYVRVTNVVNKRSMVVRVNDRGPYERDRVIDLSERAADALGFRQRGTGRVRVQYLGRASVAGSDDDKLMASLRSDGLPATLPGARDGVRLAAAEPSRPAPPRSSPPVETARASVRSGTLPEYAEPRRAGPAPVPVAVRPPAAPERRPLDIRPPARPEVAGIY